MQFRAVILSILAFVPLGVFAQSTCQISVNAAQIINVDASRLLGVSFDGRSSGDFNSNPAITDPIGYHDPASGLILPAIQPLWNNMPIGGLRYPGNLEIYNWNWSYTIGPVANRIPQATGPGGSSVQTLAFGFDEFMAMAFAKGLSADEVQIMVNLYPSTGQPDPAILAADWVEYCNAPNNGSNPRNGTDWAALRATYGHPEPYGIKIWNIGNEPWSSAELGATAAAANTYIGMATAIVDSMLAADPTIHITIPTVLNSSGTSAWHSAIAGNSAFMDRIYGFSPHAFYDEDATTNNPNVVSALAAITALANNTSKKVIAGDHAHFAPNANPDKAMQWEGALATANYLLGISQVSNIELGNFWIYGNVKAAWHPIRQNANGTFTLMAAAQLYQTLFPEFLDYSVNASLNNVINGAAVSNTRAGAFINNSGSKATVIALNTDLNIDHEIIPPALSGFDLQSVRQLTAGSLSSDTANLTYIGSLPNGNYAFPNTSLLIFNYCTNTPPVILGNSSACANDMQTYSVTPIAGSAYTWTVTGGTIISGQGTNSITVQWNGGTAGTVQVSQTIQ